MKKNTKSDVFLLALIHLLCDKEKRIFDDSSEGDILTYQKKNIPNMLESRGSTYSLIRLLKPFVVRLSVCLNPEIISLTIHHIYMCGLNTCPIIRMMGMAC